MLEDEPYVLFSSHLIKMDGHGLSGHFGQNGQKSKKGFLLVSPKCASPLSPLRPRCPLSPFIWRSTKNGECFLRKDDYE